MKEIPNRLQCAYCIRNKTHGGECTSQNSTYDEKSCLVFKPNPKGCIRSGDGRIPFPLYKEIPLLNTWQTGWQFNEIDTEIRIAYIKGLSWDTKKGNLIIYCRYDYYVNEYHDDYEEFIGKPNLKIIK